jgi:hypothetical protein
LFLASIVIAGAIPPSAALPGTWVDDLRPLALMVPGIDDVVGVVVATSQLRTKVCIPLCVAARPLMAVVIASCWDC